MADNTLRKKVLMRHYIPLAAIFLGLSLSFNGPVQAQQEPSQNIFDDLAFEEEAPANDTAPASDPAQSNQPQAIQTPTQDELDTPEDPLARYRQLNQDADQEADSDLGGQGGIDYSVGQETGGEPTPEDLEAEIRKEAFEAAVNGLLPMKPDEIRRFLELYDEVKQASNTPIYPYPKPESKIVTVSLDPKDAPPVIKVAVGHITNISILDTTGAPWPVGNMTWAGDFEIAEPEEGGHRIRVTPLSDFAYGNMSLTFPGLQPPVIFTLQAQREKVHVRYEATIPEPGPFAKPPLIRTKRSGPSAQAGSVEVTAVLDGTPPPESKRMDVSGTDGRTSAYMFNGQIYLRTPLTLISPAWKGSASSADGMNVYVLNKTPVVLLSEKGKVTRVFLNEDENAL
jgi:intracellular multiplication protein IcmK